MDRYALKEKFEDHLLSVIAKIEKERSISVDLIEIEKMHTVLYGYLKTYQLIEGMGVGRVDVLKTLENTILFLVGYMEEKQAASSPSDLKEILFTLNGFMQMYSGRKG